MDPRRHAAYARSDLLLLLAGLLREPPVDTGADAAAWIDILTACGLAEPRELVDAAMQVQHGLAQPDALLEYHRLFSGGVACPINECGYVRRDKGAVLGDIGGFHRAFGVQVAPDCHERADHLASELQFLALTLLKLGHALGEEAWDAAALCADAGNAFVGDHLGEWIEAFGERLAFTAESAAYQDLARFLLELWPRLRSAAGWPPPSAVAPSAPATAAGDDGSEWDCALGEAPDPTLARAPLAAGPVAGVR